MQPCSEAPRTLPWLPFSLPLFLLLAGCGDEPFAPERAELGTAAEQSKHGVLMDAMDGRGHSIGNSLPGGWRPFSPASPWNTRIPDDAGKHPDSDLIMAHMAAVAPRLAFAREYTVPIWTVNASRLEPVHVRSDKIFDWWDQDRDGWSDVGVPMTRDMWPEQTSDGHICIIDPVKGVAWEMSRFAWPDGEPPTCTTFNVWDLRDIGHGNHEEGDRWGTRGGRGAGFPLIGGLLRPEEVEAGEIRHALVFTFSEVRETEDGSAMFVQPPACRGDGDHVGEQYPVEGMLFQLDPAADDDDFDAWGLTEDARVVARALQRYGMYLGDRGGDWKIQVQLLDRSAATHVSKWNDRLPGIYRAIEKIPSDRLRIVFTGETIVKEH